MTNPDQRQDLRIDPKKIRIAESFRRSGGPVAPELVLAVDSDPERPAFSLRVTVSPANAAQKLFMNASAEALRKLEAALYPPFARNMRRAGLKLLETYPLRLEENEHIKALVMSYAFLNPDDNGLPWMGEVYRIPLPGRDVGLTVSYRKDDPAIVPELERARERMMREIRELEPLLFPRRRFVLPVQ